MANGRKGGIIYRFCRFETGYAMAHKEKEEMQAYFTRQIGTRSRRNETLNYEELREP